MKSSQMVLGTATLLRKVPGVPDRAAMPSARRGGDA